MCQCIANAESGGNANAMGKNTDGSYDVGLWQINSFNWASCSGGSAPCNPSTNLECAKKVYAWGGNTFKLWSTCGKCNCLAGQQLTESASSAEWTLQTQTTSTVLIGVSRGGANGANALAAASQDGTGAVLFNYADAAWARQPGNSAGVQAGLLMGAGLSSDASLKVVTSMLPIFVSDSASTYTTVPDVGGTIQSASVFNTNSIGVVGSLIVGKKSVNGVAFSNDRGATWSSSAVPSGYARYGAFVSANTWLVSVGIWGDDNSTATATASSKVVKIHDGADFAIGKRLHAGKGRKPSSVGDTNANGWLASVSMTTDGGATWTETLRGPEGSQYYFNAISCSGQACVVVGEGDAADGGYLTVAFTSADGGLTWTQTWNSEALFSLMSVAMTSSTTGWLAGVTHSAKGMTGQFYSTSDAGATWTLAQSLPDCYPASVSFASGQGVASCISSSGASGTTALYNA